jgi:hypothetical protein
LAIGDEFREGADFGGNQEKIGKRLAQRLATTISEGGMPGRMVRNQDPKEFHTSLMIHKPLTMLVLMIGGAKKGTKAPCRAKAMRVEDVASDKGFHAMTAATKCSHAKAHGVDGSDSSMDPHHGQETQAT